MVLDCQSDLWGWIQRSLSEKQRHIHTGGFHKFSSKSNGSHDASACRPQAPFSHNLLNSAWLWEYSETSSNDPWLISRTSPQSCFSSLLRSRTVESSRFTRPHKGSSNNSWPRREMTIEHRIIWVRAVPSLRLDCGISGIRKTLNRRHSEAVTPLLLMW